MNAFNLFYSFRARLLLVLAALLVMTLGVQYFLNLKDGRQRARITSEQEQAIMAGVALGVKSITSGEYIVQLQERAKQPLLGERARWVTNILVVDNNGNVIDSLNEYNPVETTPGKKEYVQLRDVKLPPLVSAVDLEGDNSQLPQASTHTLQARTGEPRAFFFPMDVQQNDREVRWYVIVVLAAANVPTSQLSTQAARPLVYTLAVLLLATLITAILVWRFTQPIKDLSDAARKVAEGDFGFRVPAAGRRDEMGRLTAGFNEMLAGLGRTRELEARLNQAERSAVVGRLASAIAHEIRNPLNYINLTLDHLRTALAPEDTHKRETFNRLTVQLKAEVARINTRISEFLNYTRPPQLELRPLKLRDVIDDALQMVEVMAAERDIETCVEQAEDVPPVPADAESLRSVFTNLFINALQAIDGEGGRLAIKLASDDDGRIARVTIADTGRGIAPENLSQLFEAYFSTRDTGTGLGLAIVKKNIEDHGGVISVNSEQGLGTTFIITLPTEKERSEARV